MIKMVGMDGNYVATVVFAGLFVVFLGLLIIIGVVYLMTAITKLIKTVADKAKKNAETKKTAKTAPPTPVKQTKVAQPSVAIQDGISDEIVAVISAAVASMADDGNGYTIRGIKKSKKNGRSIWAAAGLQDNTRAF